MDGLAIVAVFEGSGWAEALAIGAAEGTKVGDVSMEGAGVTADGKSNSITRFALAPCMIILISEDTGISPCS
jgi:hypothetical protein